MDLWDESLGAPLTSTDKGVDEFVFKFEPSLLILLMRKRKLIILAKMGKVRKPELTALTALFTAILAVCGKVNFTNLSRYSDRHEKTYRRQFKKGLKAGKFNGAFVDLENPRSP
jgi:hypothetical protein